MVPGVEGSSPFTHPIRRRSGRSFGSGPRFFLHCDSESSHTQGCSQVVRQGTLTPSLAGSSPAIPAKVYPEGRTGMIGCLPSCENKPSAPLAQSVEHLPFKQGVRGSNPRRGTKKRSTALRCFSFWHLVDSKRAPASHDPTGRRSRTQYSTRPPGQHPPIFLLEKLAHLWYNILTLYSKRRFAEGSP